MPPTTRDGNGRPVRSVQNLQRVEGGSPAEDCERDGVGTGTDAADVPSTVAL